MKPAFIPETGREALPVAWYHNVTCTDPYKPCCFFHHWLPVVSVLQLRVAFDYYNLPANGSPYD